MNTPEVLAAPAVRCPAVHVPDVVPCDPDDFAPLVAFLVASEAAGNASLRDLSEPLLFPRGALLPGGRLDACKQSLGPRGAQVLAAALGS